MAEEMIDIVDKDDKVVNVVTRKEMRKKNLRHKSTFVIVFNSQRKILVTKRTKTKDVYPGLYEISHGGTVVHGETFEESAYKELAEEVGIKNIDIKFLFDFSYKDDVQNCIGKVYSCIYDGKINVQEEEVESYFFISIEKLKEMIKEKPEEFSSYNVFVFQKYLEQK